MTSLPTWAVWLLSFGSPSLTAVVAYAEVDFIYAALDAALDVPVHAIEQAGGDVEIIATASLSDSGDVLEPSEEEDREEA